MHTILVISGGLLLLAASITIGHIWGGWPGARRALLLFLPLWLLGSAINMYMGVTRAGYSVAQELPILLIVFGVPALVALAVRRVFRYDRPR